MKRSIVAGVFLLVLCIGLLPANVYAHDDNGGQSIEERNQAIEEREQQRLEKLEATNARRCEKIKTRLEAQRDKGLEIREHREKRYLQIVDRLNRLADRLDSDGIDTTALRTSIRQLSDLIAAYSTSFTEFETELQEAINSSCDETGVVKENVKSAREKLVVLKSNADDIHGFFQTEIKPLLQSIKEQIKQLRQSSATGDTDEASEESQQQETGINESTNEE